MTPATAPDPRPRLLLVGGGGGLLGRSLLPELTGRYRIRSVHRRPLPAEQQLGIEWIAADVAAVRDWAPILDEVDVVVNLVWLRWARESRFRELALGLERLLVAACAGGVRRFVQVSVPPAPASLEGRLPYLRYKREFDSALSNSGLSYRIVRPTMMFAPGDVLLTVMLRTVHRYRIFPMFGDGGFHLSPIAAADVARVLAIQAESSTVGTLDLGGPERWRYRDLTDLLFRVLDRPPRYWHLSPRGSIALARALQGVGSSLLYAYEVEWLMSDLLGPAPTSEIDRPLARIEPFLRDQASRWTSRRGPTDGPGVARRG